MINRKSRELWVRKKIIKIDYDMTIDSSPWPGAGTPVPMAIETIKELSGRYITVLDTCRSGDALELAIAFLESEGIVFDYVNKNPYRPMSKLGDTRKVYADISIDDKNLFTPLDDEGRVDWIKVRESLGLESYPQAN